MSESRSLTMFEAALIAKLCSTGFRNQRYYQQQIPSCNAVEEGCAGDIRLLVASAANRSPTGSINSTLLAEGSFEIAGQPAGFLLFGREGLLYFLERHGPGAYNGGWTDPPIDAITFRPFKGAV